MIDISNLVDERTYFTKSKEEWMTEKLNKANEQINQLQTGHEELKTKGEYLQYFTLDLQYQLDTK